MEINSICLSISLWASQRVEAASVCKVTSERKSPQRLRARCINRWNFSTFCGTMSNIRAAAQKIREKILCLREQGIGKILTIIDCQWAY